jgi:hypothetical protein
VKHFIGPEPLSVRKLTANRSDELQMTEDDSKCTTLQIYFICIIAFARERHFLVNLLYIKQTKRP